MSSLLIPFQLSPLYCSTMLSSYYSFLSMETSWRPALQRQTMWCLKAKRCIVHDILCIWCSAICSWMWMTAPFWGVCVAVHLPARIHLTLIQCREKQSKGERPKRIGIFCKCLLPATLPQLPRGSPMNAISIINCLCNYSVQAEKLQGIALSKPL